MPYIVTTFFLGMSNSEDWQARITSLQKLQALATGDGAEFDSFLPHLKGCHELVMNFISSYGSKFLVSHYFTSENFYSSELHENLR